VLALDVKKLFKRKFFQFLHLDLLGLRKSVGAQRRRTDMYYADVPDLIYQA
jgi:hypothetical protein